MIRIVQSTEVGRILARKAARFTEAEEAVRPILENVRKRGDKAVMEYARQFDRCERKSLRVTPAELEEAQGSLSKEFRAAVKAASANIRAFAKAQLPVAKSVQIGPGHKLGQIVRPLDTVAAYIPAGRYPLPSTVLMTVIPAMAAGVPNVCVTSPRLVPEIFGAAAMLHVPHCFQIGGAHAIAAFASGTKTIPRADRIVGPGNIYVAAAKKLLAGETAIDFIAGPTEILIIAAEGNPRYVAADMLAQAEHDTDASAVLLTTSEPFAKAVQSEIEVQIASLPTAPAARKAIDRNSAIILVRTLEEALEISNRFAPEHLSIPDASMVKSIKHAGSIFIGEYSPEAAGDYASGTNHVLPTGGAARQRGGLSALDFVKIISTQQLDARGLRRLETSITTLARAEGLEAHARSVEVRLGK
jgi:histidinol dehydrogenase